MIDFIAGYHEWQVLRNGVCIYSFDDFSDYIEEETEEESENVASMLIDCMSADEEKEEELTESEKNELFKLIKQTIIQIYL